jgi:putative membrane protein
MKRLIIPMMFVAIPALAQSAPSPSRPDLDQPSQKSQPSDVPSRDIQSDRGVDADKAENMPSKVGTRQADNGELTDIEVLSRLHHVNQQEIDLANAAAQKAQMPEVKTFAQMIIKDHQQADQDLQKFAQDQKMTLRQPRALNQADATIMSDNDQEATRLRAAPAGADFDKLYANAMLQGHSDVIAMIQQAKSMSKDAAVKGFYDKVVPVLEKHRDHAADIVATLQTQGEPNTGAAGSAEEQKEKPMKPDEEQKEKPIKPIEKDQ